ncbi:cupin domain-containing protein [Streptomyces albidoflavus]
MQVVAPSPAHVTATPNAVMTGLAAPSRGSTELSTWRVRMEAEAAGPVHTADREQVWTVLSGALEFTCDAEAATVSAGGTVILPAGATRRVRTVREPAEALVAMAAGGAVTTPGSPEPRRLPWAE